MNYSHSLIGFTHNQLPIDVFQFGDKGTPILIIGGVHGDEVEGLNAALFYKKALSKVMILIYK